MAKYKVTLKNIEHYYEMEFFFADWFDVTSFADHALKANDNMCVSITIIKEEEVNKDDNL